VLTAGAAERGNGEGMMAAPLISAIVPTWNRPAELALCLDGFAQQTLPRGQFEVIVVDDCSAADVASVTRPFARAMALDLVRIEHSGVPTARNVGIGRAQAPLLLLYDDDLRPAPDLLAYCLDFHRAHPAEEDAALLYFELEPALAREAIVRWSFDRMYGFPREPAVLDWRWFWGGTTTCKKSLFERGQFNPAYLSVEDTEFALRISRSAGLCVHFEPRLTGAMIRRVSLAQIYRRQYLMGYYRNLLARDYPRAVRFPYPPYDCPEQHIIGDAATLRAMLAAARSLERKASEGPAPCELLSCLWRRAEIHATASGWMAARDGFPPVPLEVP
jgi:glycosyltransferase involved in cell wall biosynthesis